MDTISQNSKIKPFGSKLDKGKPKGAEMLDGMEPQVKKPNCKIRSILESLEPKDREILVQALADSQWTAGALARELTKRGLPVSEKPVQAHKRKGCSCAR